MVIAYSGCQIYGTFCDSTGNYTVSILQQRPTTNDKFLYGASAPTTQWISGRQPQNIH
jgi:hypothetical protein